MLLQIYEVNFTLIHNEAIISKWQLGCLTPCSINYYTLYFFIIKTIIMILL